MLILHRSVLQALQVSSHHTHMGGTQEVDETSETCI